MSTIRRIYTATRRTVKKITDKAEQVVDSATLSVKVKTLELRIEEKYEELGRVIYRDLHIDDNLEEEKLAIIAEIDALFDRIATLKEEIDEEEAEEVAEAAPEEETATEDAE